MSKISKKTFVEKKTEEKKLKFYHLEETEHILNGIECSEKIDEEALDKLIRSNLLKKTLISPFADTYYETERDQLLNYKELIKNGNAKVKYTMKSGISFGRVIPKKGLGLFNIRRQLRQTLCKKFYVDIDVENCHPVIMHQIATKNKIDCEYLPKYINKRKEILKQTMELYDCNRDIAKRLFIRLMYFGSFKNWALENKIKNAKPTPFIENFTKEIKEIGTYIFERNKQLYTEISKSKEEQGKKEFNVIGSVVSYYLQEWEHRILEEIYSYCVENELINNDDCVLCADGIMIKKENYDEKLLKIFSDLIKENLNLKVTFTQKEMDEDYLNILDDHILNEDDYQSELLNYDTKINDEILKKDFHINTLQKYIKEDNENLSKQNLIKYFRYSKAFKYFNHYHCNFYQSNKLYKVFDNKIEAYGSLDGLKYLKYHYSENKKNVLDFPYLYNNEEDKQIYSSFEFNPNLKDKTDKYNLFRGFKYDDPNIEFDENIIKPFLDHIKYIFNDCEEAYEYFINWQSHIIQKPDQKTAVAVVIFSHEEGVGKNLIWDIFGKLLTGYTAKFRDTNALTDKFNSEMMGKLFVIGDEIKARAQEVADELKDIITRKEENVEFKGKDKFMMNDYKNYAFTTNNEKVFKITKSDRRYFINEVLEKKKDLKYYDKLASFLNDDEFLKHLHYFYKNRDIMLFNPRNIVMTDYKKRLILEDVPAYYKFMLEQKYEENYSYETKELYKDIILFAKQNKLQSTFTETFMSRQLKKVLSDYNVLDKTTRRSIYIFPSNSFESIKEKINNEIFKK